MNIPEFRVFNVKEKKMYYPDFRYYMEIRKNKWHIVQDDKVICDYYDGDILMQYTGLVDSKGTKIFEGDILQYYYNGKSHNCSIIKDVTTYRIQKDGVANGTTLDNFEYDHDEYMYCDISYKGYILSYECFQIIGNIYENPEILKEQGVSVDSSMQKL